MTNWALLAPDALWLLLILPVWLVLGWYHHRQERLQLTAFYARPLLSQHRGRFAWLTLVSLLCVLLAFARPAWDPKPIQQNEQGRDIIFLLDVSRSMLAADQLPNRLEAARQAIRDTVNASENDRFALVAFAGSTVIKSPLTHDKAFFLYLLEQLNSDSVAHGGTRIEDALFKVMDKMVPQESNSAAIDLVMLTDGEDLGSRPERAIARLNQLSIRLLIVGLGDPAIGARVPARNGQGWAQDQGREYWSKLQLTPLQEMAQQANQGIFFPVATAKFDLAESIEQLRQLWPSSGRSQTERMEYTEGYPYLIFLALISQLLLILNRKQRLLIASLMMLTMSHAAWSAETQPESTLNTLENMSLKQVEMRANSLANEFPDEAAQLYQYIAEQTEDVPIAITANYNQAVMYMAYANRLQHAEHNGAILTVLGDERVLVDPLTFYRRARDLLQHILQQQPEHSASAKNLQYLMTIHHIADDLLRNMEQQANNDPDDPLSQDQSNKQDVNKKDSSQNQPNQDDLPKETQDSNTETDAFPIEIRELKIPPPNTSADEVIAKSKQINSYQRSPAPAKKEPVEKDW